MSVVASQPVVKRNIFIKLHTPRTISFLAVQVKVDGAEKPMSIMSSYICAYEGILYAEEYKFDYAIIKQDREWVVSDQFTLNGDEDDMFIAVRLRKLADNE